jgi:hypothetical protein
LQNHRCSPQYSEDLPLIVSMSKPIKTTLLLSHEQMQNAKCNHTWLMAFRESSSVRMSSSSKKMAKNAPVCMLHAKECSMHIKSGTLHSVACAVHFSCGN